MPARARFAYVADSSLLGSLLPRLPLTLQYDGKSVDIVGLLDTGATVNVLPHRVGLALGASWVEQSVPLRLSGSLGAFEARALLVGALHPQLTATPVRLIFAWTLSDDVPVILGQVNFFLTFDVCFFRADGIFEVTLRELERS